MVLLAVISEPGLTWHRPIPAVFPHQETGYWAATRHADIKFISQHEELFCSSEGVSVDPMPAEIQRNIAAERVLGLPRK